MASCFLGRGELFISESSPNSPLYPFAGAGDISFSFTETLVPKKDYRFGRAEEVEQIVQEVKGSLITSSSDFNKKTLEIFQGASVQSIVPATITNLTLNSIVKDIWYKLEGINLSSVVILDGLGIVFSSLFYTLDLEFGLVKFNTLPALNIAEITVSYPSYSIQSFVKVEHTIYKLYAKIQNITGDGDKILLEFYKCFIGYNSLNLRSKQFNPKDITITLLSDYTKENTPILGRFGRISYIN